MYDNQEDQEEDNDILDTSWMMDEEQFTNLEQLDDKTPMNEIQAKILYISSENKLINTETEICSLQYENEYSIFPRDSFVLLIQKKKNREKDKKYRLSELLLYNVEIEPVNLQNYSKTTPQTNDNTYLKIISTMNEIRIPSSIRLFHPINTLYFIFQEINVSSPPNTKPILKIQGTTTGIIRRKTKKVEFNDIGRITKKNR